MSISIASVRLCAVGWLVGDRATGSRARRGTRTHAKALDSPPPRALHASVYVTWLGTGLRCRGRGPRPLLGTVHVTHCARTASRCSAECKSWGDADEP